MLQAKTFDRGGLTTALGVFGDSYAEAHESGDLLRSSSFNTEDGNRTFVTLGGEEIDHFKNQHEGSNFIAYVINDEDDSIAMVKNIGDMSKETSSKFDARLDRWDFASIMELMVICIVKSHGSKNLKHIKLVGCLGFGSSIFFQKSLVSIGWPAPSFN